MRNQTYDVCIVGTGPAGLTLCNELVNSGKKICLVESGSKDLNKKINGLKKIISIGEIKIKDNSRERVWGGTSNTWAGLSAPLDEIDFEKWPIKYSDLNKFYSQLDKYGYAKLSEFEISSFDEIKRKSDITPIFENLQEKIFIAGDPPANYGKKFINFLDNKNVDVFLDSTVIRLNKNDEGSIDSISVINPKKETTEIHSKKFIICTGGLESTRLLLISDIGNESNQVGKYLMNHPKNNFGILELNGPVKKIPYLFGYLHSGFAKYAGLRIKEDIQRKNGLLNSYIRFEPMFPWTDSRGVYALISLSKRAKTMLDWWKKSQKGIVNLKDWNETGDDNNSASSDGHISIIQSLIFIISDLRAVFLYALNRLQSKKEIKIKKIRIRNFMEMEPCKENEMTLSNELDVHGNKIPIVNLNTTETDRRTLIELHKIFKAEVEKNNLGKYIGNLEHASPWPINFEASHHLGGTIMGIDEKKSVVDTNLKVHTTNNLYICSGSVFPTSGCANPTYTICALAIRLAEHLKTI